MMRNLICLLVALSAASAQPNPPALTGTHFPQLSDFPELAQLGYDFALIVVDPSQPDAWKQALDAAQSAGLKLIVGAYPLPYAYNAGNWSVSPQGQQLLAYLQSRSSLVLAVYVFNEPYGSDPYTGNVTPCGNFSAADLRALRATIQSYWPGAKINHDIGSPADWAPGGAYASVTPCVGTKYADQSNMADYVGIWYYPFLGSGDQQAAGLANLKTQVQYVLNSMKPAVPVSLNQSYACSNCIFSGYVFPTASQLYQWNCAVRSIPFGAVSWYPWRRFSSYSEALADAPALWPLTTAASCGSGMGSSVVALSAASGMPFVAPDSFVSLNGSNLAPAAQTAQVEPLPLSLSGVNLQITDSGGNLLRAALSFVSPQLINFVMPSNAAPGQAAISADNGLGTIQLGTAIVRNVAPALFSADGTGTGVAAAAALAVNGDQQTVTPVFQCSGSVCAPAPIDLSSGTVYLILYGTGIRHYQKSVLCSIAGTSQPVQSAGAQPTYDGLDQVNVGPLTGLAGKGTVKVYLIVDGYASNTLTVQFK